MSLGGIVGDLGCPGVDVEAFKKSCRVPVYGDKWNRWLLWRTDRDNPSGIDIERTTFAAMRKWFELVEQPSGMSWPGKGSGYVDNLKVRIVAWDWQSDWGRVVARRESCTPMPMLGPGGAIGVAVEFVYRGTATSMPWPLHQQAVIGSYCPTGNDWMLARAYAPPVAPVPEEKGALDEAGAGIHKAVRAIMPSPMGLIILTLAGLGVVLVSKTLRRTYAKV